MLLTKLHIPAVGNSIIHRSELFENLNSGLSRKLILVSAPPGFGKTTVVSDWISQNRIPAAWISLDNGDNDPAVFLSYVISGIQSVHKEFGESAIKLLNSPNSPSCESIASVLINEILNINQNFLLVFDDFHLINNGEVQKLVTYLIGHIPGNVHIVILTRSDPALSVSRLRSQNQLVELRSSDLGFSANDISILFNKKLKLGLSIDDIYSLESKTEGWIAGLQLTALSMRGCEDIPDFIQTFKGDNRYIMDYLMEEVLKIQPEEIKEFLLQTSILEEMSAPLCDAVLNRHDSQLILETLEKNNMFVVALDSDRTWYRYHHLFADLLKQRLKIWDKVNIIKLHNKACSWFEQHRLLDFAIRHALIIHNYDKSINLIGGVVEEMWENGQHDAILKYGSFLPDELIKTNPPFCLYYSWILIINSQLQKAEPLLASAEKLVRTFINHKNSAVEDVRYNKKLLGKISGAYAYLFSIQGDAEKTFIYSKAAMENLSEEDPLWLSWVWYSIAITESLSEHFNESIEAYKKALEYGKISGNIYLISKVAMNLAYFEIRMGRFTSSYKNCSDLIAFMKESGYSQITKSEPSYAGLYSCMATIECMRSDFEDALKNIKIAYNLSKNDSNYSHKVVILLVYSLIQYGRGESTEVINILNEADQIMQQNKIGPAALAIYIGFRGFIHIEQHELEKASQFFKNNGLSLNKKISYFDDHGYFSFALLLITENKCEEAEKILSELLRMAQVANRIEALVEVKILYAILNNTTGDKEKAFKNLIDALKDATNDNILMPFIYYHDRIKDLLKDVFKILATTETSVPKRLIEKLNFAIEKREKFSKLSFKSGLSVRELDILRLISEDLTNHEIADKLFISLQTVKTHVKNILLKLDVDSRRQAAFKSKELGII
jgi:LuxR family transcriptional regulator, maltose regulon positive regulatory protein